MNAIEEISQILTTNNGKKAKPILLEEIRKGCIVCVSHKPNPQNYLLLTRNKRHLFAHRRVYEHFYGPIPEGLLVCHKCDNPSCQNPEHFFIGTPADNQRDMSEKGRGVNGQTWTRGEKHGKAKLTTEKVLNIRKKYATGEYTQASLARESGVSHGAIRDIIKNINWRHL